MNYDCADMTYTLYLVIVVPWLLNGMGIVPSGVNDVLQGRMDVGIVPSCQLTRDCAKWRYRSYEVSIASEGPLENETHCIMG